MAGHAVNDRLKYFSRAITTDGVLNILLVSTSQFYLDEFGNSLSYVKEVQGKKRNLNVKVHTCKTIVDVLKLVPEEFYVDFIVFILDLNTHNPLTPVEYNLSLLDPSFTKEKICIVNPDSCSLHSVNLTAGIWEFARYYQFNLINGSFKDHTGKFNTAKKIFNLAEGASGYYNGLPMIALV